MTAKLLEEVGQLYDRSLKDGIVSMVVRNKQTQTILVNNQTKYVAARISDRKRRR